MGICGSKLLGRKKKGTRAGDVILPNDSSPSPRSKVRRSSSSSDMMLSNFVLNNDDSSVFAGNAFAKQASGATKQIFMALDLHRKGAVSSKFFTAFLARNGLLRGDSRLTTMFTFFDSLGKGDQDLSLMDFDKAISDCRSLIHKCVSGALRLPDFELLTEVVDTIFDEVEPDRSGDNAQYIPQLAEVNPEQFSVCLTSVDGQQYARGDSDEQFCIQSCSKPISYLIGVNQFGQTYVHNHVGTEPSGHRFDEMVLKNAPLEGQPNRQIPHNPMINAGAIMTVSMVHPEIMNRSERLAKVLDVWRRLSAGAQGDPIGYSEETYVSESGTADRNWCLAYMMKERGAYPPCFSNLSETLELYFQICSILSTNRAMSIMAATLANGGVNPRTGQRVFSPDDVRSVLPLMLTAGMYDYSGQWAYDIGVPAKSGVGGCVFLSIPNVAGVSIWSPRLDAVGNSVRAVAVATMLTERLSVHNFEVFSGLSRTKWDPTMKAATSKQEEIDECLFAASQGDVQMLTLMHSSGTDLHQGDYDQRTALHLAAAEGHLAVVKMLLSKLPDGREGEVVSAYDRWHGTPLDDANDNGWDEIASLLKKKGAKGGTRTVNVSSEGFDAPEAMQSKAQATIYAAASGKLDELVTLSATGTDLSSAGIVDYDGRTPLHLAASNGHTAAVSYLLARCSSRRLGSMLEAKDRWASQPLDDARREGHEACARVLETAAALSIHGGKRFKFEKGADKPQITAEVGQGGSNGNEACMTRTIAFAD